MVNNADVELLVVGADREVNGVQARMKNLLARPFCPKCHLFLEEHDDETCDMRYEEDEPCVLSVQQKLPSPELLRLLDGGFGFTVL